MHHHRHLGDAPFRAFRHAHRQGAVLKGLAPFSHARVGRAKEGHGVGGLLAEAVFQRGEEHGQAVRHAEILLPHVPGAVGHLAQQSQRLFHGRVLHLRQAAFEVARLPSLELALDLRSEEPQVGRGRLAGDLDPQLGQQGAARVHGPFVVLRLGVPVDEHRLRSVAVCGAARHPEKGGQPLPARVRVPARVVHFRRQDHQTQPEVVPVLVGCWRRRRRTTPENLQARVGVTGGGPEDARFRGPLRRLVTESSDSVGTVLVGLGG